MANMIPVDVSKIDKVIAVNGIKQTEMGRELGHDSTFISGIRTRKTMQMNDILLFKSLYGVDIRVETEKKSESSGSIDIDYDKLAKAVSKVIDYDRLEDIMLSIIDYDRLSEAVCGAMVRALEGDSHPKEREKRKLE